MIPGKRVLGSVVCCRTTVANDSDTYNLAGFGLGALNDAEEDDLDVYEAGPSRRASNRLAYDIDGDEKLPLGSRNHDRNRTPPRQTAPLPDAAVFHDGRPVLPGFMLADKALTEDIWLGCPNMDDFLDC